MSKYKFKVGDYVIIKVDIPFGISKGTVGKVIAVNTVFDDEVVSFACGNRRININTKYVDLYTKDQPDKIVITTDGKTTTAKMYRDKTLVKVQTTKCHPDDRFDFEVGARIAFDRLVGEKKEEPAKPKHYNGKVVCVDTHGHYFYTKGKVYSIVDGKLFADDGDTMFKRLKSVDDLNKQSNAKWLEVVE